MVGLRELYAETQPRSQNRPQITANDGREGLPRCPGGNRTIAYRRLAVRYVSIFVVALLVANDGEDSFVVLL